MSEPLETLAAELETFNEKLPEWQDQTNRFVLIAERDVLGFFDTYADAVTAGYKARGLSPFLVKQVGAFGAIANFTRDLFRGPCLTTAS